MHASPVTATRRGSSVYFEQKKIVSPEDADALRRVVAQVKVGVVDADELFDGAEHNSKTLVMFEDVYRASSIVWKNPAIYDSKSGDKAPRLLSREGDGMLMDGIGVLLGEFLGGRIVGYVVGAFFSIMYFEAVDNPWQGEGGWVCPDWCDVG